ncbi:hypothetical protein [Clostridium formicaceticum]|uniref:Uncharacterized protein n=1 Tax=Clostridium formicaceticum TaxID=1497 RepID=A0AAC9WFX0_9CLOT|nr:hypothetical protein [Clostridium formicaceticum]AOY76713.1 hypothetical protein BJL90_13060 [Clostridium formicaceticum]ARE87149.1 hypothetical protein CLFO_15370 [Clostridium formicaceticum]
MNAQKANNTIDKVRQLQRKLYLSAKANSKRRYHALYDKVYRTDILMEAWKRVKSNGGVGGIDRITIMDIESYGVEKFLVEIQKELINGTYHPLPVRSVFVNPKFLYILIEISPRGVKKLLFLKPSFGFF